MWKDIKQWVAECKICQKSTNPRGNTAPLHPLPVVAEPWDFVAMDIVGPFPRTKRGHKYLLTLIDLSTRFPEAIPVKAIDCASLIEPMVRVFSQHGVLRKILTDQGSNFTGKLFSQLCNKLGVTHIESVAYRPQTNGTLERFHRSFKTCLYKHLDWREQWDTLTPYILFALRETVNKSTFCPIHSYVRKTNQRPHKNFIR